MGPYQNLLLRPLHRYAVFPVQLIYVSYSLLCAVKSCIILCVDSSQVNTKQIQSVCSFLWEMLWECLEGDSSVTIWSLLQCTEALQTCWVCGFCKHLTHPCLKLSYRETSWQWVCCLAIGILKGVSIPTPVLTTWPPRRW